MAKLTAEEFIASLKEMTILEINEVVKAIEEEFGVSAAAPVAVAAAGADEEEDGPSEVTVTLTAIHNTISQKVNWTLSLYNKTTEIVIVGPAEIGIKYNSSDFKANPIGDEQELVFPSVSVPALGYFNQSGSFENIPYPNDMYVYFYDYYTEELFKQINIQ